MTTRIAIVGNGICGDVLALSSHTAGHHVIRETTNSAQIPADVDWLITASGNHAEVEASPWVAPQPDTLDELIASRLSVSVVRDLQSGDDGPRMVVNGTPLGREFVGLLNAGATTQPPHEFRCTVWNTVLRTLVLAPVALFPQRDSTTLLKTQLRSVVLGLLAEAISTAEADHVPRTRAMTPDAILAAHLNEASSYPFQDPHTLADHADLVEAVLKLARIHAVDVRRLQMLYWQLRAARQV